MCVGFLSCARGNWNAVSVSLVVEFEAVSVC